jgi:ABC-2 type transport system ATP-binding protein
MRVELSKIHKRYRKVEALAGVDLDLAAGSRVALIGPNGSGKTTLTRVVMGLVAHAGEVRLDGAPAAAVRRTRGDAIAYVPQVAPQMAASVGELVRIVAGVRGVAPARITEVAGELGLDVAAVARRSFRDLSGGMKQKLLIALALGVRPRLVILDEPTASLDAAARSTFLELERELLADATVILCSHRLDELRALVDRVVALEEGRVVHDGDATAYVRGRTRSVFEVRLAEGAPGAAAALEGHGFTPTTGGWWSRAVDHDEKLRLLPAVAALGDGLRDVVVRDLDRLALPVQEAA